MMEYRNDFIVSTNDDALHDTMNGIVTGKLIRCRDCVYRDGNWCKLHSGVDFDPNDVRIKLTDYCSSAKKRPQHGRWVWNDYGGVGNYHCSVCRQICMCNGNYAYCPHCGARMETNETD